MRARSLVLVLAMGMAGLSVSHARPATLEETRVSFRIRTLIGAAGAQETVSDAIVEGAPGTDITLDARTGRFAMTAKLKTDVIAGKTVRIVADFVVRRDVGHSERGLTLYEEDAQHHVVELAVDGSESLVVLPFGRNPDGENLSIEVEPSLTQRSTRTEAGDLAPPEIRLGDAGLNGWLRVSAVKIPHRFFVRVELLREGRVVGSGAGVCELDEAGTVRLATGDGDAALRLTVTGFARECPVDRIDVDFDILAGGQVIARGWAGSGSSNTPFEYALGQVADALPGRPDTLRFAIASEEK